MKYLKTSLIKIEKLLFYLLLFLIPSQLSYHFWPEYSFIFGIRVDYLSPTIFLTDILAILLISLSRTKVKNTWLLIIFVLAGINISVSHLPLVSLWKWVKILELIYLTKYIFDHPKLISSSLFAKILSLSFIFISLVGILQFLKGGTIGGILYFLGERSFDINTPGIALQTILGKEYMRAYSTFSHPNSLAGYLVLGLIYFFSTKKRNLLNVLATVFSTICLFLTFSLSAFIGLFVYVIAKNFKIGILILVVLLSLMLPFVKNKDTYSLEVKERIEQANFSKTMISNNFILGTGLGTFPSYDVRLQPIHNVFLLVFTETGFLGFLTLILLLHKFLKNRNSAIFILLIVIGIFDHYFLTLQQNMLSLSFVIGAAFNFKKS